MIKCIHAQLSLPQTYADVPASAQCLQPPLLQGKEGGHCFMCC